MDAVEERKRLGMAALESGARGGGYFFLPGIAALKFIAGAKLRSTHRLEAAAS